MKQEEGDSPLRIQETEQPTVTFNEIPEPTGIVAQEVAEVIPEAVSVETDDTMEFIEETIEKAEPKKDWEPELYKRVKPEEEKVLGRYESELLEQQKKNKVQSFLTKVGSIEQDVEDLQNETRV